ncbi:hypothetical protein LOTGIDRAFT_175963 [Lottia gigantea]|uniref:Tetraspanin n=1 Tax=Lottia gigantea TaxID=225164 RepID=V3ZXP0_LOTGI|nr:hypothetical protein LOTGIDRAFT_175963 [Lottia gigantea]ESO87360.1 hypothetical protein LOTGIDRAFT_175963 [Lottia gigantea]
MARSKDEKHTCRTVYLHALIKIMGILITACGSWILNERTKLAREISEFMLNPAVIISVFGIILVFITLFGCIGTIRENILLIKTLHYSLTVVLFIELILSVIVVVFYQTPKLRHYLHSAPEEVFKNAIKLYHDDEHLEEWLDLIQMEGDFINRMCVFVFWINRVKLSKLFD